MGEIAGWEGSLEGEGLGMGRAGERIAFVSASDVCLLHNNRAVHRAAITWGTQKHLKTLKALVAQAKPRHEYH